MHGSKRPALPVSTRRLLQLFFSFSFFLFLFTFSSTCTFADISVDNPATGKCCGTISALTAVSANAALEAAKSAAEGELHTCIFIFHVFNVYLYWVVISPECIEEVEAFSERRSSAVRVHSAFLSKTACINSAHGNLSAFCQPLLVSPFPSFPSFFRLGQDVDERPCYSNCSICCQAPCTACSFLFSFQKLKEWGGGGVECRCGAEVCHVWQWCHNPFGYTYTSGSLVPASIRRPLSRLHCNFTCMLTCANILWWLPHLMFTKGSPWRDCCAAYSRDWQGDRECRIRLWHASKLPWLSRRRGKEELWQSVTTTTPYTPQPTSFLGWRDSSTLWWWYQ